MLLLGCLTKDLDLVMRAQGSLPWGSGSCKKKREQLGPWGEEGEWDQGTAGAKPLWKHGLCCPATETAGSDGQEPDSAAFKVMLKTSAMGSLC